MTRDEMDQEAQRLLHVHNDNERKIACLGDRLSRVSGALTAFLADPEGERSLDAFKAIDPPPDIAVDATDLAAALQERKRLTDRLSKEFPYLFRGQ